MKSNGAQLNIKLVFFFATFLPFISSANEPSCIETAMTQSDMNQCILLDYKKADAELNRVYRKIREIYKDDQLFLAKLKKSQLAWGKLRDADFELEYPYTNEPNYYGSSFSMCEFDFNTQLTLQRTKYLKRWLIGREDGDVCSGSQKSEYNM